ncbi:MAG: hypothetical protein QW797_02890 [Thermoproteota archaeon]
MPLLQEKYLFTRLAAIISSLTRIFLSLVMPNGLQDDETPWLLKVGVEALLL